MSSSEINNLSEDERLAHLLGDSLAGVGTSVQGPDFAEPFDKFEDKLNEAAKATVQKPVMVGVTAATLAAGTAGCIRPTPTPLPPPPTSEYRPIEYEPTEVPTPERIRLQDANAAVLNEELLKKGVEQFKVEFPPMTGELPALTPEAGRDVGAGVLPIELPDLVAKNWDGELTEKSSPQTDIEVLQVLVSIVEGVGTKQGSTFNLREVCPWLGTDVRFFSGQRTNIESVEEILSEASPWQATLRKDAQMTFIGRFRGENNEERYVVAFSDWIFRGPDGQLAVREGAPKVSFAVVNQETFEHLLQEVDPGIRYEDGFIVFPSINGQSKTYEYFIHTLSPELGKKVEIASGLEYVPDAQNPVVRYPSEEQMKNLPERWGYSHVNGVRGIFPIQTDGTLGEEPLMVVTYDSGENKWNWNGEEENVEINAPAIEGLRAVKEEDQIVYRAEEGNKYGLEVGKLAGRVINMKIAKNVEFNKVLQTEGGVQIGLVLHPKVVEKLLVNQPGKVPFFFDPQGNIEVLEVQHIHKEIHFKNTPVTDFVSPYTKPCLSKSYIMQGGAFLSINFFAPTEFNPKAIKNLAINLMYNKGTVLVDNGGRQVRFGETVLTGREGKLPHPPFPSGVDFVILKGSLGGQFDMTLEDIFSIDSHPVFLMSE